MSSDSEMSLLSFDSEPEDYFDSDDLFEDVPILPAYEELNESQILASIESAIQQVTSACSDVSKAQARFLLQSCQWEVKLVIESLKKETKKKYF